MLCSRRVFSVLIGVHVFNVTSQVGSLRELFLTKVARVRALLFVNGVDVGDEVISFAESPGAIITFVWSYFLVNCFYMLCKMALLREGDFANFALKILSST